MRSWREEVTHSLVCVRGVLSFMHAEVLELLLVLRKNGGVYTLTHSMKEELEEMKDSFVLSVIPEQMIL